MVNAVNCQFRVDFFYHGLVTVALKSVGTTSTVYDGDALGVGLAVVAAGLGAGVALRPPPVQAVDPFAGYPSTYTPPPLPDPTADTRDTVGQNGKGGSTPVVPGSPNDPALPTSPALVNPFAPTVSPFSPEMFKSDGPLALFGYAPGKVQGADGLWYMPGTGPFAGGGGDDGGGDGGGGDGGGGDE